jgi:hypothetical protein
MGQKTLKTIIAVLRPDRVDTILGYLHGRICSLTRYLTFGVHWNGPIRPNGRDGLRAPVRPIRNPRYRSALLVAGMRIRILAPTSCEPPATLLPGGVAHPVRYVRTERGPGTEAS